MVFRNLRTGRLVSTDNPDTIQMMQRSDSYEKYVAAPAPAPKPKPAAKKPAAKTKK